MTRSGPGPDTSSNLLLVIMPRRALGGVPYLIVVLALLRCVLGLGMAGAADAAGMGWQAPPSGVMATSPTPAVAMDMSGDSVALQQAASAGCTSADGCGGRMVPCATRPGADVVMVAVDHVLASHPAWTASVASNPLVTLDYLARPPDLIALGVSRA
jgi:hypothetical protein